MADGAVSADPAVQRQLDRIAALGPGADVLGLDRITRLLARIGDPHRRLPPVFHVAGTNGKGSTCAFLRTGLEAAGYRAHVYTSPHLVRFNERIRLAGQLIDDAALTPLLEEVLDAGAGIGASFFEVTTAAAFLAFARSPADACVIEVGLGGRLDATNVIPAPAVCGIAQLGVDHEAFLGADPVGIASEKAGIAKAGAPLVTLGHSPRLAARIGQVAEAAGARLIVEGRDWSIDDAGRYRDARGVLRLAQPALPGAHQWRNAGLATAMLRHQNDLALPDAALVDAAARTRWPARLQRLGDGPLTRLLSAGSTVDLDGGHNPAAADAIVEWVAAARDPRPLHLVVGMLANKDADGLLAPILPLAASLTALPIDGHEHHPPRALAELAARAGLSAATAPDVAAALEGIAKRDGPAPRVLILGSLYLAGAVLETNGEPPD